MRRQIVKRTLVVVILGAGLILAGGSAFVYLGVYNVSALKQHTPPVFRLLQFSMERSVAMRSDAEMPQIPEEEWRNSGLLLYEEHCQQCHGAPGVAPDSFSLGMVPAPTAIVQVARRRSPQDIFWVIKHGIKMSGMPAWKYRMTDREIWKVVALVDQLPKMTVSEYGSLRSRARPATVQEEQARGVLDDEESVPDDAESLAKRGQVALQQYNCVSCHDIPGVTAGRNHVGPPLGGLTERAFIAGVLEFNEENFIRWVRFPQRVDPDTAMPNLGVTEAHAREMLAYLKSVAE